MAQTTGGKVYVQWSDAADGDFLGSLHLGHLLLGDFRIVGECLSRFRNLLVDRAEALGVLSREFGLRLDQVAALGLADPVLQLLQLASGGGAREEKRQRI